MTALEAQWSPVRHLILGDDPPLRLYAEVAVWHQKIELFRQREDERMVLHAPSPEDLAIHKSLLQRLIADGDHLLSLIQQIGLPENLEGVNSESVAASVDLLRADYRGWHVPMPAEQRDQILSEVFPDVT